VNHDYAALSVLGSETELAEQLAPGLFDAQPVKIDFRLRADPSAAQIAELAGLDACGDAEQRLVGLGKVEGDR
jgi:hypothetical protein